MEGGGLRKLTCRSCWVKILTYDHNIIVTAETYPMFQMFYSCDKSTPEKNSILSTRKLPSFVKPRNAMLQHLIFQFPLYYLSSGHLQGVKNVQK